MSEPITTWIATHFDDQVRFLQALVRVPTDTPPGNNAPHAERTAELLTALGFEVERHAVPAAEVQAAGMQSITNLIVRHRFSEGGPTIALNAHGDVVPPGEGWTHDPYGAEIVYPSPAGTPAVPQGDAVGLGSGPAPHLMDGKLYGRAAAVSKSDFATYTYALLALKNSGLPLKGAVELHFTYDEEFGGELGPGWLLAQGLTRPDYLIAAGFSYQVVTAHNGCLQMEVTLHGLASHAAYPHTGVDALQAATRLLTALYAHNDVLRTRQSQVAGITHPYLNVGRIEGGSNTNVVPGKVVLKLDRRMIPEEDPAAVEAEVRALIEQTVAACPGIRLDIKRLLLAHAMKPLPSAAPLVAALQKHGEAVFGEPIPTSGTPLYTDVRLYTAHGIPAAIYGAGPRTVLESNAKRADEHLNLADLQGATRVVALALAELLAA
ncbi:M20/M25/M40 family metallo-hydrolase [Roseateles puraquae]|uniref:Peptidase M20 n=1 Tax=Roseateles puraquae TaxID=431059 RepID=A0A254N3G2_9BURK|nr:M20/M25/M40 family metallo-hydrolase [Roseateles puraquae]MDG0856646.1 M20/M25/M40 family metallo-hydrolase [Roseateles puraquae]OWR00650.1 peptidase M20 [Roseateles puraquae]